MLSQDNKDCIFRFFSFTVLFFLFIFFIFNNKTYSYRILVYTVQLLIPLRCYLSNSLSHRVLVSLLSYKYINIHFFRFHTCFFLSLERLLVHVFQFTALFFRRNVCGSVEYFYNYYCFEIYCNYNLLYLSKFI